MAQDSQDNVLLEQLRQCYARAVWTHKTHEKCADILNRKSNRIKIAQIVLSVIITTGIIANIFKDQVIVEIFSAVCAFFLTLVNVYLKEFNLVVLANKHAEEAVLVWNIRECYLSLLSDVKSGDFELSEIRGKRDLLQEKLFAIYKGSPRTFDKAYRAASSALKKFEEHSFSDCEIDGLLPNFLKKQKI